MLQDKHLLTREQCRAVERGHSRSWRGRRLGKNNICWRHCLGERATLKDKDLWLFLPRKDMDCSADEQIKNEIRTELRSRYMSSWKSTTNSISVYAPQSHALHRLFSFWHWIASEDSISCRNARTETDRLGPPPIPLPLVANTRDHHLTTAHTCINVDAGLARTRWVEGLRVWVLVGGERRIRWEPSDSESVTTIEEDADMIAALLMPAQIKDAPFTRVWVHNNHQ